MPLNDKQRTFASEYLVDLNATQAAIRAGYSAKAAKEQGYRLLTNAHVAAEVARLMAERRERTEVTADQVVRELIRIGFCDPRLIASWGPDGVTLEPSSELSDKEAAAVAEVGEKITRIGRLPYVKLHSKTEALKLLGQHLGMFVDRTELTGKDGAELIVKVLGAGTRMEDI